MTKLPKIKLHLKDKLVLELYVSGMSQRSMEAIENVKRLCEVYIKMAYQLDIIDIYKHPDIAAKQDIVFSPSLIKRSPLPQRTLIGNFSDTERVMRGLGITHNI